MQDWPYAIWIGLVMVGATMIWGGISYAASARKTWDWPTTTAKISRMGQPKTIETVGDEGGKSYSTELDYKIEYFAPGIVPR